LVAGSGKDDGRLLGKIRKEPPRARKPEDSGVWTGMLGSRDEEKERDRFRLNRSSEVDTTWSTSTKMPHATKRRPQRRLRRHKPG